MAVIEQPATARTVRIARAGWWSAFRTAAVLVLPALGALAVALHGIGDEALWRDEVWSVDIARRPLGGVFEVISHREANMSLYYLLLHGWLQLGHGDGYVRLLSTLPATGAVLATGLVARAWFGHLAAAVASTLMATNLCFLGYAQEARAYTLTALLTILSCWSFVRMMERRSGWDPIVWAVVTAGAVYSQVLAGLIVIAQAAALPARTTPMPWRRVGTGLAGLAILVLPLAVLVVAQRDGQTAWVPATRDIWAISRLFAALVGDDHLYSLLLPLVVAGLALALRRSRASANGFKLALLVTWTLVPVVLLYLLSLAEPMFVPRYLIGVLPGLALLAGAAVAALPRGIAQHLLAAAVMTAAVTTLLGSPQPQPKREDLGAATAHVARAARAGDAIAYESRWARVGFAYHLRDFSVRLPDVAFAASPESRGDILAGEAPRRVVAQRMRAAARLWVVTYPESHRDLSGEVVHDLLPSELRDRRLIEEQRWGNVVVSLYTR